MLILKKNEFDYETKNYPIAFTVLWKENMKEQSIFARFGSLTYMMSRIIKSVNDLENQ